jgi:Fe2+ transport system protein B
MKMEIDESKLKDLLKVAILELLAERKELIYDLLMEVMEDLGLVRAIQEQENGESVSREVILQILAGKIISS